MYLRNKEVVSDQNKKHKQCFFPYVSFAAFFGLPTFWSMKQGE